MKGRPTTRGCSAKRSCSKVSLTTITSAVVVKNLAERRDCRRLRLLHAETGFEPVPLFVEQVDHRDRHSQLGGEKPRDVVVGPRGGGARGRTDASAPRV